MNRSLQACGVNIWQAADARKKMDVELEDLALRSKTDATHKNKCDHVEAALAWMTGKLRSKPLSKKPSHLEKALTHLRITKTGGGEEVHRRVDFATPVTDEKGATMKMTTLKTPYSPDLVRESLAILRKAVTVLQKDVKSKYAETDFASDVRQAFSVSWRHDKDPEPGCVQRLIKRLKYNEEAFSKAWRDLHQHKESVITDILDQNVLKGMQRDPVNPLLLWPAVLRKVSDVPAQWEAVKIAAELLEVALLLEPSNAGVERGAGTLRAVKDIMHGGGDPLTKDSRVRMKLEGPEASKVVKRRAADETDHHPLVREASKDFLLKVRRLNGTNAGCTKHALTDEHKENISNAAKKVKVDDATDIAIGVACASLGEPVENAATEAEVEEAEFLSEDAADALMQELDTDEFLSTQAPQKKKLAGRGRGGGLRGRGHGPAAAEGDQVDELAEAALAEEDDEDAGENA